MARPKKKQPNMTAEADVARIWQIVQDRELMNKMLGQLTARPGGSALSLCFVQTQSGVNKNVSLDLPSWMFERIRRKLRDHMDNLGTELRIYGVEPRNL